MTWARLGRQLRAVRLRLQLPQEEVARRAGLSRSVVSLLERGHPEGISLRAVERVVAALDARLEPRLFWRGPELDRLTDAAHAALSASVKERLEGWGWLVRVEVSYNHYGERGRIDLLAWHPVPRSLLVVEVKTSIADVQALLGSLDAKTRIASSLARRFAWEPAGCVPAIAFLEDRTTRRRVDELRSLFDRFDLRGRAALVWLRRPAVAKRLPGGLMWFSDLSNAKLVRISGQRVRGKGWRTRC